MVKEKLHKIFNTTKILLVVALIICLQTVSTKSLDGKISNDNLNKSLDLSAMSYKLNEIQLSDKYYPLDTFTGDLTGYVADCPLCNGHLGCTGQNVLDGTTTYQDQDYGNVRIVASSKNLKCGSIIEFESSRVGEGKTYAIVLDRGVIGTDIDLLTPNEGNARYVGRSKFTYNVLRNGWTREA